VINALRERTEGPGTDRFMAPEIEEAVQFVATGGALRAVETVTGPLA
jgi:histidine ammonia-lyase